MVELQAPMEKVGLAFEVPLRSLSDPRSCAFVLFDTCLWNSGFCSHASPCNEPELSVVVLCDLGTVHPLHKQHRAIEASLLLDLRGPARDRGREAVFL